AGLIDDLLDASRLQAGALALDKGDVDVGPLLERQVARFRTQAESRRFVLDLPAKVPLIRGDEQRLTQVIANLLSNAVKYSPDGSEIRVALEASPAELVVCVSDEGRGIDPAEAPHVFERFYRSADVARSTQGTGLGLFLAKAIVEAHGGRIWVDPRVRRGARLCFSLPLDPALTP
ncbi:MAG TPA: ATP-binding protein, partial [Anaerolineales bacterium]|nr:ATP-binding protein [Anaerolineales bacterium]